MQKTLSLLLASLLVLFSGSAFAHDGLFAHPHTGVDVVHLFMHVLMLLPLATVAFFLSRWLLRRSQD